MKRCIICGNVDDDSSTVCSTCGNPYVDMGTQTPDADGDAAELSEGQESGDAAEAEIKEEQVVQEVPEADRPEEGKISPEEESPHQMAGRPEAGVPGQMAGGRPPRRTRSGPQIYGQMEGMDGDPELYAGQGVLRRDVSPRPARSGRAANQVSGNAGRPMGQAPGGAGRPTGRMSGGAGRPMGQTPGSANQDFLARRVMETARRALKSPLFLLIVILNTVHVAASIAAIFLGELNYSQVVRLLNGTSLPEQISGYVNSATTLLQKLDSGMIVENLALHIPSVLFCLGLWLVFITAMAAKERMSGVGFGFAMAAVVIRMIVACVVSLGVLVVSVTVVVGAWVSKEKSVLIAAVIMLVIAIVVVMMIIMYYFAYLGTMKTCRQNSNTGESYGKLSGYLAVMLVILALPGIIGLLSGIVNMEISNIVGSVAKMGWMLLLAVWIFLYRGRMGKLEN